MTDEEMRLEAFRIASQMSPHNAPGFLIHVADRIIEYVKTGK